MEVRTSIQFGDDAISPVAIVELGKTADIRFTTPVAPGVSPSGTHAALSDRRVVPLRTEHRVRLTVRPERDLGYNAHVEYLTRRDGRWILQWAPAMFLKPKVEGTMSTTARSGEVSSIALTIEPRRDVTSLGDLASAGTNQACDDESGVAAITPLGEQDFHLSSYAPSTGKNCCKGPCGPFTIECCNACCDDALHCPGQGCCPP